MLAGRELELAGDRLLQALTLDATVGEWFGHPTVGPALTGAMMAGLSDEQKADAEQNADALRMVESMPMRQFLGFLPVPIPGEFLDQLIGMSQTAEPVAA